MISLSCAWGAHNIFFSAVHMILPVAGGLLGLAWSLPVLIGFFLIKKSIGLAMITGGLPTLCAMANWSLMSDYPSRRTLMVRRCEASSRTTGSSGRTVLSVLLQLVLPAICMGLFALHPVGNQAFSYALYWLIPMAIFFARRYVSSVFLTALSSTFIAHAVGSVIWLYTVPMTSAQWLGLIPIVAAERLVFAVGATLVYAVAKMGIQVKKYLVYKSC